MKILVDCDGVMANFSEAYLNVLMDLTGRQHCAEDVTTFDFRDSVATTDEDAAVWAEIARSPGFVMALPAYPGTQAALKHLRALGEVVCVTAPRWGTSWAEERYHWLERFGFDGRSIVMTSNKGHVDGDVLIDDYEVNLQQWRDERGLGLGILVDRPWNRAAGDTWRRVSGLQGAVAHFERLTRCIQRPFGDPTPGC